MHAFIFGMHVVEANSEFHKLNVVFATTCVPLLLAFHEPRLQIGKCYELNHDNKMFFLEHNETPSYNT
jgi:ribosomal protein S27AE